MTKAADSLKPSLLRIIIRMVEATKDLVRARARIGVSLGMMIGAMVGVGISCVPAFKKGFFHDVLGGIALGLMGMVILGFAGFFFGGLGGGLVGAVSGIITGLRRNWHGLTAPLASGTKATTDVEPFKEVQTC